MKINEFKLERYFAKHEFSATHLLSSSDCESLTVSDLQNIKDLKSSFLNLSLGYTESDGDPELKRIASNLYGEHIQENNIFIAAPAELIFLSTHALLSKDDEFIITYPAYQSLYEIPCSLEAKMKKLHIELGSDGFEIDLNKLKKMITNKTKLLIINFPHNPTGYIPTKETLNEIVEIARERGIYILSDEMYRYLEIVESDRLPAICDIYEKGISLTGLSKAFGLPGLRIGWLAFRDESLKPLLSKYRDYTTICNSAPSEFLAKVALLNYDIIYKRSINIVRDNLLHATSFFEKYENLFHFVPPKGSSVCFPKLNTNIVVDSFCNKLLTKKSIMLVPGSMFDHHENHFRLGLGRLDFSNILNLFESFIEENY